MNKVQEEFEITLAAVIRWVRQQWWGIVKFVIWSFAISMAVLMIRSCEVTFESRRNERVEQIREEILGDESTIKWYNFHYNKGGWSYFTVMTEGSGGFGKMESFNSNRNISETEMGGIENLKSLVRDVETKYKKQLTTDEE